MTGNELLALLTAFRSVSSISNLDCIAFIRGWLAAQGIDARILLGPDGNARAGEHFALPAPPLLPPIALPLIAVVTLRFTSRRILQPFGHGLVSVNAHVQRP